ncbi:protein BCCIP homolog [Penaeus indicus]|uniref:protein BCCIP homolog n=1 Tax=Penaeus indicus TaxID=29960 RepID=UPI00300C0015
MSGPMKKPRAVFPEEEYVPEESDEEMEQDEMIGQMINVDFEGFPASDSDFHGIKRLLQQNLRGLDVDISGIADTVISQNYVGSVIKQVGGEDDGEDEEENEGMINGEEDKDEVFGVTSVINLTSRKVRFSYPLDADSMIICNVHLVNFVYTAMSPQLLSNQGLDYLPYLSHLFTLFLGRGLITVSWYL